MKELPQNFAEHAFRARHVLTTGIEERVLRPTDNAGGQDQFAGMPAHASPAGAAPRDDGGPAFPHMSPLFKYDAAGNVASRITELDGMSLRDWFAGQAIAGWLASSGNNEIPMPSQSARIAYEIADAMLAERSKRSGS